MRSAEPAPRAGWVDDVRAAPPRGLEEYQRGFEAFFDHYATTGQWRKRHQGYHEAITSVARFYVPRGARVLEVGCGTGDLLASLKPSYGVGVDLSQAMVRLAAERHPLLIFHCMAAERLELPGETFDYIILSDLVGYLYDIGAVFKRLARVSHRQTRVVIHWYSRLWQPVLHVLEWLGWRYPVPYLNWTTVDDVNNLLRLAGFETVRVRGHILLPMRLGVVSRWANRFLAHLPVARWFVWTNWVVARLAAGPVDRALRVSVICPCRNEKGHIEQVVRRFPSLGSHTELIFVEGHSQDDTLAECHRVASERADLDIKVMVQQGKGKADAVHLGLAHASGDVLMILDADLAVAPEDLTQFYDALVSHVGDFAMGSRLVYTMDPKAMRFLNLLGNRFFGLLLKLLVGQPIKDPLCGVKALWREDYERLVAGPRGYFSDLDPYGDFDLIFGAAKLSLRIVEIPVRYRARGYGTSNISRFADGWLLLKMSARAALRLFFIK